MHARENTYMKEYMSERNTYMSERICVYISRITAGCTHMHVYTHTHTHTYAHTHTYTRTNAKYLLVTGNTRMDQPPQRLHEQLAGLNR